MSVILGISCYFHDTAAALLRDGVLLAAAEEERFTRDNVDDLGVCSCFVGRMPTRDVVFTETGRYSPLTNATALRAANAYVLYRSPDVVVAPLETLRSANSGAVPDEILRGHYVERLVDRHADAAVYARTAAPLDAFQTPHVFLENLAHPTRLLRAFDGDTVPEDQYVSRLPFVAEGRLDRSFSGSVTYDLVFAASDLPVFELDVTGVWARTDVLMTLTRRPAGTGRAPPGCTQSGIRAARSAAGLRTRAGIG